MERGLRDPDIDVYLTWDTRAASRYGPRVVAVLLSATRTGEYRATQAACERCSRATACARSRARASAARRR